MELGHHFLVNGLFNDPRLIREPGPVVPGMVLVRVPVIGGKDIRFGLVLASFHGTVLVLWNDWPDDARFRRGELADRLGVKAVPRRA